jgi:hypothetical protein
VGLRCTKTPEWGLLARIMPQAAVFKLKLPVAAFQAREIFCDDLT